MPSLKTAAVLGASLFPIVQAKHTEPLEKQTLTMKPSEIPLYKDIESFYSIDCIGKETGKLEEGVSVVRKEIQSLAAQTKDARDKAIHIYETGKAHTLTTKDYILEEENIGARVGAITFGAFTGLLLASRKGFFKKLMYTSAGAGAVAAACYPKEAYNVSEDLVKNAEVYSNVAYNFLAGAKPNVKISVPELTSTQPSKPETAKPEKVTAQCDKAGSIAISPESRLEQIEEFEDMLIDALLSSQMEDKMKDVTVDKTQSQESHIIKAYNEALDKELVPSKVVESEKDQVINAITGASTKIQEDFGQGNAEDKDMYTTRT